MSYIRSIINVCKILLYMFYNLLFVTIKVCKILLQTTHYLLLEIKFVQRFAIRCKVFWYNHGFNDLIKAIKLRDDIRANYLIDLGVNVNRIEFYDYKDKI